ALKSALDLRLQLVREHPLVLEYKHALARNYFQLGTLHRMFFRKQGQAKELFEEALKIQEPLNRAHPREIAFAISLAETCAEMGVVLGKGNQPQDALDWFRRNIEILETVLQHERRHSEALMKLSATHMNRAETLI